MRDQMAERHTSAIGDGLKNERLISNEYLNHFLGGNALFPIQLNNCFKLIYKKIIYKSKL